MILRNWAGESRAKRLFPLTNAFNVGFEPFAYGGFISSPRLVKFGAMRFAVCFDSFQ
jgi:hypothetical protein